MCGLAGFINFKDPAALIQMAGKTQQHRGPDAQSAWQQNNVLLTHQRLSIIDLDSRSNQPFVKDGLVILFNGEIYNYQQLKEQVLQLNPATVFKTTSDTEVLLELYRLKKESCLDELIGMFVFVIYETETGKLFIARDHFGIKPLFYTQIGNSFAFASELKTLVKVPGFTKSINFTVLLSALNYLWVPGDETMFTGCKKLPAAHYIVVDTRQMPSAITCIPYWNMDTTVQSLPEEEYTEQLAACLEQSIQRHMVADVEVSSFLSGGLDSSLISVMAAKINPNLSTYTIATTEKDKKVESMPDDEKYARRLANQFHFNHHEILLQADVVNELPKMVYTLDEPIGDPAAINTYLICKAARERGIKVLLSGMGADEIFSGYRRHKAVLLALHYQKLPGFIRKTVAALVQVLPVKIGSSGLKLFRWAKRFISFAGLPAEEAYMRSYSYYSKKELQALCKNDITESYNRIRTQHSGFFNRHYADDVVNRMCFTDIHLFMQGLNLSYSDRASMAASVEVRVPFIDKKVVQLAMHVPGKLKYHEKQSKYILKKVAERYLPHEIIYRPKASFGAPIRSWISNELQPMVNDLLSEENVTKRGLFNYTFIKKLIEEDRMNKEDHAYKIYQLLTIELWFRTFIDE